MDTHAARDGLADRIAAIARPLPDPAEPGFAEAFDDLAGARIVLLGECTHGTAEFHRARDAITRRLVDLHGFSVVALEADWPDAAQVDAHVRGLPRPAGADGPPFSRFPTWMWRNAEFAAFVAWLRGRNLQVPPDRRAAVRGLDIYGLDRSMAAVLAYLDAHDPRLAAEARAHYACLDPWRREPERYGRTALAEGFARCEEAVATVLRDILERTAGQAAAERGSDGHALFDARRNARLVAEAERYHRAMYLGRADGWNLRDRHMAETLDALLERDPSAKAVVWAHNSHLGDARATAMASRGEVNLGQLARERHGDAVRIVGFGTHAGTVAAADDWDGPVRIMEVRPSLPGSWERAVHDAGVGRGAIRLDAAALAGAPGLRHARPQRFVGVVYRPETERRSHYMECRTAPQYDVYVFFDETRAATPLAGPEERAGAADGTFPFGL
jgi:erythromycin esterase-like protein